MGATIEKCGSKGKAISRAIRFQFNGKRMRVRLVGKVDYRGAQEAANRIDELLGLVAQGNGPDAKLGAWLAGLSDEQHERIARTGLVESRHPKAEDKPKTLTEHLDDWRDWLAFKANTEVHNRRTIRTVERLLATAKVDAIDKITAPAIAQVVRAGKESGAGLRTCNADLVAIKSFTSWAHKNGRLSIDPLSELAKYNAATDRKLERRALSVDELGRLIDAAQYGGRRLGVDGPGRALLYRTAAGTGFRANELRSLTRSSFDLDTDRPAITVTARNAKGKRESRQPIREDLAQRLRPWLATLSRGASVFKVPHKTAEVLQADLRLARARWIKEAGDRTERRCRRASDFLAVRDEAGRVVDFHALRATFITHLIQSGASVKVAQELARHRDPKLTMNVYTKLGIHDLAGAARIHAKP